MTDIVARPLCWDDLTPTDILADINTALLSVYENAEWWDLTAGCDMLISMRTYWFLKRGAIDLLLRSRKTRRPERFTRK